jgi:hypothetical protein
MFYRSAFFRVLVIPACLAWGLVEFLALQRAHLSLKKLKGNAYVA